MRSIVSAAALLAVFILAILSPVSSGKPAGNGFYVKDGDTVVFYGDSITEQRLYTTDIEDYVLTRFPELKVDFVHSGVGGDRVSGGWAGPIDLRLKRDLTDYRPTVVTIMLGMNDASYRSYDQAIFDKYADGYRHIISSLKSSLPGVRVTLLEPSPFDDITRPPTFPGGYNSVLVRYSGFVKELAASEHLAVADLNSPVVATLEKAEKADPGLARMMVPDRVHPSAAGHLIMAEAVLKAWHAPALVTSVDIDAARGAVTASQDTQVTAVKSDGGSLTWDQQDSALPFPIDLGDQTVALAMKCSDFVQELDRQPLRITGLAEGSYSVKIDGQQVGAYSSRELADGVDLGGVRTPMWGQAMSVHRATQQHTDIHNMLFRMMMSEAENPKFADAASVLKDMEAKAVDQQRAAAQPKVRHYRIEPVH